MAPLIVANWKMHGSATQAQAWAREVAVKAAGLSVEAVFCPPAILLSGLIASAALRLGGQDCSAEKEGAFTGDISASMLKEAGCDYVILGHSERRQFHGEADALIATKAVRALSTGLTPIVCVGETLAEREKGKAEKVVAAQVAASLPKGVAARCVIAYEPVWAIGSGRTPTGEEIAAMHAHIAKSGARVIYGGSVKAANAAHILGLPHVAGVLAGAASLNAAEFCAILEAAHAAASSASARART